MQIKTQLLLELCLYEVIMLIKKLQFSYPHNHPSKNDPVFQA